MENIVTFGKYKNQPVEVLAQDQGYTDWLLAQSWFKDKNPSLYNIVINNFQEPSETPEHNALQAKFLDEVECSKLVKLKEAKIPEVSRAIKVSEIEFEKWGVDVVFRVDIEEKFIKKYVDVKVCETVLDFYPGQDMSERLEEVKKRANRKLYAEIVEVSHKIYNEMHVYTDIEYEVGDIWNEYYEGLVGVEIKSSLGDDYPAVLRQIKSSIAYRGRELKGRYGTSTRQKACSKMVLYAAQFQAIGATLKQVREIFKQSKIHLVVEGEDNA